MNSDEATAAVIDALDALHVPYMLVGSFSSNFYGVPRSTQDADFVVQLQPGDVFRLAQHLGPPFQLDPTDVVRDRNGHEPLRSATWTRVRFPLSCSC